MLALMSKEAKSLYLSAKFEMLAKIPNHPETLGYKMGGLYFLGDHKKLRALYQIHHAQLSIDQKVLAQFHLGLSFTATSDYKRAKRFFKNNLLISKTNVLSNFNSYFVFQGLSFFSYFFSKHQKSQSYAQKAYKCILQENHPFLEVLNLEIQGYNEFHLGLISSGFMHLEKALKISNDNNLKDFGVPIEYAILNFKCEFSPSFHEHLDLLLPAIEKKDIDIVSKVGLVLSIAKAYFYSGQYKKAHAYLTQNFIAIYSSQNKRLLSESNMLLAKMLLHKSQPHEALAIVNTIQNNLNPVVDKKLILSLLQIQLHILDFLNMPSGDLKIQIEKINTEINSYTNQRRQLRDQSKTSEFSFGEDLMGDLLDEIKFNCTDQTLEKILNHKAYHLLFRALKLDPQKNYILQHPASNSTYIITQDEIFCSTSAISKTLFKMLNELKNKPSKEALIKNVWGYQYDPLRHDSLIYTSLARLRNILGPASHWIINDEEHYFINAEIGFLSTKIKTDQKSLNPSLQQPEATNTASSYLDLNLNLRQIEFLNENLKAINVENYAQKWKVTTMTALRDLKQLCELGYLKRLGRARATQYYRL